jgi:site-specific recombinase XerD
MKHIVLLLNRQMDQPTVAATSGLSPVCDGSLDAQFVDLWLAMKTSVHTRRAYSADIRGLFGFVQKPLSRITLADLRDWAAHLGQGSLKPASRNRALTAVKSLFSFAQKSGCQCRNKTPAFLPVLPPAVTAASAGTR